MQLKMQCPDISRKSTTLATPGISISTDTKSLRVSASISAVLLALGILLDLAESESYATRSAVPSEIF